jgi:hypothetical protein
MKECCNYTKLSLLITDNSLTVSTTLQQDCVMTALREKTVILVTHQVEFLSDVDSILVKHFICIPILNYI